MLYKTSVGIFSSLDKAREKAYRFNRGDEDITPLYGETDTEKPGYLKPRKRKSIPDSKSKRR